jgi:hypothetical protein
MLSERMLDVAEERLRNMNAEMIRCVYVNRKFYSIDPELKVVMERYTDGSIDAESARQAIQNMRRKLDGYGARNGRAVTDDGEVFEPWVDAK